MSLLLISFGLMFVGIALIFVNKFFSNSTEIKDKDEYLLKIMLSLRVIIFGPMLFLLGLSLLFKPEKLIGDKIFDFDVFDYGFFAIPLIYILLGVVVLVSKKITDRIWKIFFNLENRPGVGQKHLGFGFLLAGIVLLFCASYLYWPILK